MINCANCGTGNRDDTKYCKNCGVSLSTPVPLVCPKCTARNPTTSLYCNRCGDKLAPASASLDSKTAARPAPGKGLAGKGTRTPATPERTEAPRADESEMPDWFTRFFGNAPTQKQLIPTHELLRMANALSIDVDYSTLRFWQKRGLVSKPIRGPVSSGRGTRGYYEPSLIDRLAFIREIQKNHSLGLESIRDELDQIDQRIVQSTAVPAAELYRERLGHLQSQRDSESKRTLMAVLSKVLNIDPAEIAAVTIEKNDGQTIRLAPERVTTPTRR